MILGRARDALLGALMLSTCQAAASPSSIEAPTPAPAPTELRPSAYALDPASGVARVRALYEQGKHAEVITLARSLLADASPQDRGRLAYVAGRSAKALDRGRDAITLFDMVPRDHPLARFAALEAAELDAPERALVRVRNLLEGWGGAAKARRIDARAGLATNREGAEATAREVLLADDLALWSIAMPLADRLEARDAHEEAIGILRRVVTRIPRATLARTAETRIAALLAQLPEDRRAALEALTAQESLTLAAALAASDRADGIEAYTALLARLPADAQERCAALSARAKLVGSGRDRARTASHFLEVAETCTDAESRAVALFRAARALHQSDRDEEALVAYERLSNDLPLHRLADDAVIYAAAIDRDASRLDAMRARLARVSSRHPQGDMRGEALCLLGFDARARGSLAEALGHFDAARALPETSEDLLGRAAYWHARTLADLGRTADALAAYEAVVRGYPLSFYAQQALARLESLDAAVGANVRASLPRGEPTPLVFDATDAVDLVAGTAVAELMVVGALDDAARELDAMGALAEDASVAEHFLAASLYDATGHPYEAVRLLRRRLETFRTAAPVGTLATMWRIAYPRAFTPLIEESASRESLPASFVRAIAREESSFDPDAVSHAHAYGLIQILVPTARGYRQAVGLEANAETLRDPAVNLRFGTRFMSFLSARYGTEMLIPPAYNAGHGALDRWMRREGTRDFDAFVESIPYEETRRYTRRVLQTYGVYAWLDEGRLPAMPLSVAERPGTAPGMVKP